MATDRRLRHLLVTPELVSGIVLVSVVIAVANENDGVFDVFAITVLSVLVFWFTEVFAHAIAAQRGREDDAEVDLGHVVRVALGRARGFLFAGILPAVFLVLGLLGLHDGTVAYWAALWVGVATLAVVGWVAFDTPRVPWWGRVLGSLATAGLGVMAMLLKIVVH